jgi:predicted nucleic acid-binding protein
VILVDTGPCMALFDPQGAQHIRCRDALRTLRERLYTTVPVLTEALHRLSSGSYGADNVREFVGRGGLSLWCMGQTDLQRV